MKQNYLKIALLLLILGLSSCDKDPIVANPDKAKEENSTNQNPNKKEDDDKKEEEKNNPTLDEKIQFMYESLFWNGQTTRSKEHTDFAQKSYDIETDLLSGDMAMLRAQYGHFKNAVELTSTKNNTIRAYSAWRLNYKIISYADTLLNTIGYDKNIPINEETKDILIPYAKIKFIRAYSYMALANLYAGNYEDYKHRDVLPILGFNDRDDVARKSNLSDVYKFLIADLLEAQKIFAHTKYKRTDKLMSDENVATAYLAYAYLTIGEYQKAYDEAIKIVNNPALPILKAEELTSTGFNDISHPDFLWGVDINANNTGKLFSFWGHIDIFTYSYAFVGMYKVLNNHLATQIPEYDLRRNWFYWSNESSELNNSNVNLEYNFNGDGLPINKFYSQKGRSIFSATKSLGTDYEWLSDIHFLRTEELYLIAAEAAARYGETQKSKEVLTKLLRERTNIYQEPNWISEIQKYDNTSLLEAIHYNWRIEMWGEGRALQTMRRFRATNKWDSRSFANADIVLSYDREELVFQEPVKKRPDSTNNSNNTNNSN